MAYKRLDKNTLYKQFDQRFRRAQFTFKRLLFCERIDCQATVYCPLNEKHFAKMIRSSGSTENVSCLAAICF